MGPGSRDSRPLCSLACKSFTLAVNREALLEKAEFGEKTLVEPKTRSKHGGRIRLVSLVNL